MAWTTPPTWTSGQVLTSSEMTIVSADLTWLYGDSAWTTPASFTNSWTNLNAVGFIRHGNLVDLRGELGGPGTGGATAFTLPVGYRPSTNRIFENNVGTVFVLSSGAVQPQVSTPQFLDNCIFSII